MSARDAATAIRILERAKQQGRAQTGAIRTPGTPTGPAYDPTPSTPVDDPATFALVGYRTRDIDGTRIVAKDKKAIVAHGTLSADPTLSDQLVEADGTAWSIIDADTIRPGITSVVHILQVRR